MPKLARRLQPRTVHRQQFATEQVELAAQNYEFTTHHLERGPAIAAEVGYGPEVRRRQISSRL